MSLEATKTKLNPSFDDAFKRLGFLPGPRRHDCFFNLIRQYTRHQSQEAQAESEKFNLNLTHDDVLDYVAVKFIQDKGDELWPKDPRQRGHLNDQWVQTKSGQKREMTFVAERDQNCVGVSDERTAWQDKLRSPLGFAVRHYLEVLQKVPEEFLKGPDKEDEFLMGHILALGNK